MKITAILTAAKKCKSLDDTAALEIRVREAFMASKYYSCLSAANSQSDWEPTSGVFFTFEANRTISDEYVTTVRTELRDQKLEINVFTN
jgi:hypothetical protein